MSHGPIAELIRTRTVVDGRVEEEDVILCLAEHEAELLARRPDLKSRRRRETQCMDPAIILFLPPADPSRLGFDEVVLPVKRNVGR